MKQITDIIDWINFKYPYIEIGTILQLGSGSSDLHEIISNNPPIVRDMKSNGLYFLSNREEDREKCRTWYRIIESDIVIGSNIRIIEDDNSISEIRIETENEKIRH